MLGSAAIAANQSWDNGAAGNSNWSDGNNWVGGEPPGIDNRAYFRDDCPNTAQTVTIDTATSVGRIFFDGPHGNRSYTLTGAELTITEQYVNNRCEDGQTLTFDCDLREDVAFLAFSAGSNTVTVFNGTVKTSVLLFGDPSGTPARFEFYGANTFDQFAARDDLLHVVVGHPQGLGTNIVRVRQQGLDNAEAVFFLKTNVVVGGEFEANLGADVGLCVHSGDADRVFETSYYVHEDGGGKLTIMTNAAGQAGNVIFRFKPRANGSMDTHFSLPIKTVDGTIIEFDSSNGDPAVQGHAISGPARVRKLAAGTLNIQGTHSYTGGTDIEQGTVQLTADNALPDIGAVTLNDGTVLDLDGNNETIGGLVGVGDVALGGGTLNVSDGITPGTNSAGELFVSGAGSVVLGAGSTNTFELGPDPESSDRITFAEAGVQLGGTLTILDVGGITNGIYRLFDMGGDISGSFTVTNLPVGSTGSVQKIGTDLCFTLEPPPEATVTTTSSIPVIDGVLSEFCWQRVPDFKDFKLLDSWLPAEDQTEAWVVRDDQWLFFGLKCYASNAASIACGGLLRDDNISSDESIEIFISPGTDGRSYTRFVVNADGLQGDDRAEGTSTNLAWNAHWRSGATVDVANAYWSAEVAIPLFYLTDGAGTDGWMFNLARNNWQTNEWSSWAALTNTFHTPDLFGSLQGLSGVTADDDLFAPVLAEVTVGRLMETTGCWYDVSMTIENEGGGGGAVSASATDLTNSVSASAASTNVTLDADHVGAFDVRVPVAELVERTTRCMLELDDSLGHWEWLAETEQDRATQPLNACWRQSYYTTETNAHLVYDIRIPTSELTQCSLRIHAFPGVDESAHNVTASNGLVSIAITNLAVSTHDVQVDLEGSNSQVIARQTCTLLKKPTAGAGNELKTDRWNRSVLLNDEPFFPMGFYSVGTNNYGMVSNLAMNTVIHWQRNSPEEFKQFLDTAHQNGLYLFIPVHYSFGSEVNRNNPDFPELVREALTNVLPDFMDLCATNPAALAWYGIDEPGADLHELSRDMDEAINREDGYHPHFPLFCRGFPDDTWMSELPIGLVDIYWHPAWEDNMSDTVEWFEQARDDTRRHNIPLWATIISEFTSTSYRMVTPREQRVNTYVAMIYDATALYYFVWPVRHERTAETFTQLAGEVTTLAPSLMLRSPEQVVTATEKQETRVQVRLKRRAEGGCLLLAANTRDESVDVTVAISGLNASSHVTRGFADGSYAVQGNSFSDHLEGYATRAYMITNSTILNNDPVSITLTLTNMLAATLPTNNLIANPGFEQDSGWSGVTAGGPVSYDTSMAWAGARALLIERTNGMGTAISVSDEVTLKPNTSYGFGARVRGEFVSARERWGGPQMIVYSLTAGSTLLSLQTHVQDLDEWHLRSGEFVTDDQTHTAVVYVYGSLGKYTGSGWLDDVFLYETEIQAVTRNLMPNSSFEDALTPYYPDRWMGLPTIRSEDTLVGRKDAVCTLDDLDAVDGRVSLRLRGFHQLLSAPTRYNRGTSADPDTTHVLSAYMKSDSGALECWMRIDGDSANEWAKFDVGTEWARYHVTGKPSALGKTVHGYIYIYGASGLDLAEAPTLWVDAVQYEEGTEPTAYVRDGPVQEESPASATRFVTLSADRDTSLRQSAPGMNFGQWDRLRTGRDGAGGQQSRTILSFDAVQIPAFSSIESMTLRLHVAGRAGGTPKTNRLHAVAAGNVGWEEGSGGEAGAAGSTTWDYRLDPSAWAGVAASGTGGLVVAGTDYQAAPSADRTWTNWDPGLNWVVDLEFSGNAASLTPLVRGWQDANGGLLLFEPAAVSVPENARYLEYHSGEAGVEGYRPQLIVGYLPARGSLFLLW